MVVVVVVVVVVLVIGWCWRWLEGVAADVLVAAAAVEYTGPDLSTLWPLSSNI